jgi:hypothetical protein
MDWPYTTFLCSENWTANYNSPCWSKVERLPRSPLKTPIDYASRRVNKLPGAVISLWKASSRSLWSQIDSICRYYESFRWNNKQGRNWNQWGKHDWYLTTVGRVSLFIAFTATDWFCGIAHPPHDSARDISFKSLKWTEAPDCCSRTSCFFIESLCWSVQECRWQFHLQSQSCGSTGWFWTTANADQLGGTTWMQCWFQILWNWVRLYFVTENRCSSSVWSWTDDWIQLCEATG